MNRVKVYFICHSFPKREKIFFELFSYGENWVFNKGPTYVSSPRPKRGYIGDGKQYSG